MEDCGCEVPLVTSDGPYGEAFECGGLEGVLQTGNFGSHGKEQFSVMRKKIGEWTAYVYGILGRLVRQLGEISIRPEMFRNM